MVQQRGRRPKPTALKILDGNPGKRAIDDEHEAKPRPVRFESPPKHLDDEAKREWRRMIRKLAPLGLYTEIDRPALVAYVVAWSRHVDAETKIREKGLVIDSPNGFPMISPWASIANKAWAQMVRALAEFGMSPSSRTRVKAEKPDDEEGDGWGGLL